MRKIEKYIMLCTKNIHKCIANQLKPTFYKFEACINNEIENNSLRAWYEQTSITSFDG